MTSRFSDNSPGVHIIPMGNKTLCDAFMTEWKSKPCSCATAKGFDCKCDLEQLGGGVCDHVYKCRTVDNAEEIKGSDKILLLLAEDDFKNTSNISKYLTGVKAETPVLCMVGDISTNAALMKNLYTFAKTQRHMSITFNPPVMFRYDFHDFSLCH